jgi:predicted enzyme related to lactoylglutathione lyase
VDWKLELIVVPVSDVDRAKAFYAEQAGFSVDVDFAAGDFRVVQLTPRGSACSIALMHNTGAPGSLQGVHLIVTDIDAACAELTNQGVEVGELHHFVDGVQTPGLDPNRADYGSFSSFTDPDGHGWVIQEVHHSGPTS